MPLEMGAGDGGQRAVEHVEGLIFIHANRTERVGFHGHSLLFGCALAR